MAQGGEEKKEDCSLPSIARLENPRVDIRDVFSELRKWVKEQQRSGQLADAAKRVDLPHRKSIFAFLCAIPSRKYILQSQSREVLKIICDIPEWRSGNAIDDASLQAGLTPAPKREVVPTKKEVPFQPPTRQTIHEDDDEPPPPPPPPPPEEEEEEKEEVEEPFVDIFSGMPPEKAFEEGAPYESVDTFKDFRKWAKKLPVWDLCAAGAQLSPTVRRNIFTFLVKICNRRIYKSIGQEVLRMLLSIEEWTRDNVVDSSAVNGLDEERRTTKPRDSQPPVTGRTPEPSPKLVRMPAVSPEPTPKPRQEEPMISLPPPPPPRRSSSAGPSKAESPKHAARGKGLRARVEAALSGGLAIKDGKDLIRLYQESGLGGDAQMSAKATSNEALRIMLAITKQRLKDIFIDDLQQVATRSLVHFPHMYIDLHKGAVHPMKSAIQNMIERKIKAGQKFTCIDKAEVLSARHEQSIACILAYSLVQAKKAGRSAVWIPMGMDTGAQGHANAVILQSVDGRDVFQVLVYDPNFNPEQTHYVHAKKAINDQLPKVQRFLSGSGITIRGEAQLFGHGLQTALGTTTQRSGWFSRSVVTTHQGYPICGAVVHLLGVIWLSVMKTDGGRGALENVKDIEGALAEIVAEPAGKERIQHKIAAMLQGLTERTSNSGVDSFSDSMKRRLDKDRPSWPDDFTRGGGSIDMSIAKGRRSFHYSF